MGDELHDNLRSGFVTTYDGLPADHAGGNVVYQMKTDDVQRIIDSGIHQIEHYGSMCFERP